VGTRCDSGRAWNPLCLAAEKKRRSDQKTGREDNKGETLSKTRNNTGRNLLEPRLSQLALNEGQKGLRRKLKRTGK